MSKGGLPVSAVGTLEGRMHEELDRLRDRIRNLEFDLSAQLLAIQRQLFVERKLADDRHETLCRRLDEVLHHVKLPNGGE